jgi:hypothetical protein
MLTDINSNKLVQKIVIKARRNTHCIICGNPFHIARTSKLYCSSRCKQYGYYHKENIYTDKLDPKSTNENMLSFYLDEFSLFEKTARMIKKHRELKRKSVIKDSIDYEIYMRQKTGLNVSDLIWESYISNQLTESENEEINEIEKELHEEILSLNLREITLEQWSFIRSLYDEIDEISFYRIISSLGKEFMSELNLRPIEPKEKCENTVIKNRFIKHCNLIAEGKIKFIP